MLFNNIEIAGFNVIGEDEETDMNMKDGALIVESIRSLLCKYYDIEHPFHAFANACFEQVDDDRIIFIAPIFKEKSEIKEETHDNP